MRHWKEVIGIIGFTALALVAIASAYSPRGVDASSLLERPVVRK